MTYDVTAGRGLDDNYRGLGWQARFNWSADPDAVPIPHVGLDERLRLNALRDAGASEEELFRRRHWRLPTPTVHEQRAANYSVETSFRHFADSDGRRHVHLAQYARDPRMQRRLSTPTATQPKMPLGTLVERMTEGKRQADTSVPLVEILQRDVLRRMYPTPIASDAFVSKNEVTLQKVENGEAFDQLARRVRREQMEDAGIWEDNPLAVRGEGEGTVGRRARLSTPMGSFNGGARPNGLRGGHDSEHRPGMWQSPGHPEFGELNPEWVEWIMDWPIGWTSPDPLPRPALEAWLEGNAARPDGTIPWWDLDPTEVAILPEGRGADGLTPDELRALPRAMSKTVRRGTDDEEDVRQARIACLGNGQVSAAMAAAVLHMAGWELPKGDDE